MAGTDRVLKKLQTAVHSGDYYGALQMYHSVSQRHIKQGNLQAAADLLADGAATLLRHDQASAAADLITRLLEVFQRAEARVDDAHRRTLAGLLSQFPATNADFAHVAGRSLRWTQEAPDGPPLGDPLLHHVVALQLAAAGLAVDAERHFALGLAPYSPRAYAAMLASAADALKDDDSDAAARLCARGVLVYLASGRVAAAQLCLEAFVAQQPESLTLVNGGDAGLPPQFRNPLTNAAALLILAASRGAAAAPEFARLRQQLAPLLAHDAYLGKLLARLGPVFFGEPGPQAPRNGLSDMLQSLFRN